MNPTVLFGNIISSRAFCEKERVSGSLRTEKLSIINEIILFFCFRTIDVHPNQRDRKQRLNYFYFFIVFYWKLICCPDIFMKTCGCNADPTIIDGIFSLPSALQHAKKVSRVASHCCFVQSPSLSKVSSLVVDKKNKQNASAFQGSHPQRSLLPYNCGKWFRK